MIPTATPYEVKRHEDDPTDDRHHHRHVSVPLRRHADDKGHAARGDFTTALQEELQPVLDFLTQLGEKLWHSIDLG